MGLADAKKVNIKEKKTLLFRPLADIIKEKGGSDNGYNLSAKGQGKGVFRVGR